MIVVDTNILAYAVLPGPHREMASLIARREPSWLAPKLWRSELRNVLSTSIRHRGLELADAIVAFQKAEQLVEDVDIEDRTEACLALSRQGSISSYDAEFVLTAEERSLRLVTADKKVARAFPEIAILASAFVAT